MQIDRPTIERELQAVREQAAQAQQLAQQAANVLQQAIGAEKAFNAMLVILDQEEAAPAKTRKAAKGATK